MNCRMTRGIYLRANGEINCYCSAGEQISLASLPLNDQKYNFISDFYKKNKFEHIRESMKNEKLPFKNYCLKCHYLDPFGRYEAEKVDTEIEWAHIEAATVCNLRCPYCVHGIPEKHRVYFRPGPKFLPIPLYSKILSDISNAGMKVKWMYFSGRGEPGLHPDLWSMVETAKNTFETNFLVNTNGNIAYGDLIVDSGLDKIKIAFDSHHQDVYSRYRINGEVDKLLGLTRRITERKKVVGVDNPEVIWQRIMFNFNDSEKELVEYQKLAMDCGVDTLWIIYTWTDNYTTQRPGDFPDIFPSIWFIDYVGKDNITLETLNTKLERADQEKSIAHHLDIVRLILNWAKFGMENRDQYDTYSNLKLSDKKLFFTRQTNPHVDEFRDAMKRSLGELSDLYGLRGETSESLEYRNLSQSISRMPT